METNCEVTAAAILLCAGAVNAALANNVVTVAFPVFADQLVNGHPLEMGSLLGMAVYLVLAFVAIAVLRGVFSPRHL